MPFIGYTGSIGLGRNLFQSTSDIEDIQENLLAWKPSISNFWNFPTINNFVEIDTIEKSIKIDDRKFDIPILIELNAELETILKFQFDAFVRSELLLNHLYKLDNNTPFILIDTCINTSDIR